MIRASLWFLLGFVLVLIAGIATAKNAEAAWCTKLVTESGVGVRVYLVTVTPSTPAQLDSCTTPVLSNPDEWRELVSQSSLWGLTPEQGSQIAGAILLVWGIAFVFRLLIRALSVGDNLTERHET